MTSMELLVLDGEYAVWKLAPEAEIPVLADAPFLSVTRTATELSVVAPVDGAPDGVHVETGWSCLEVRGPLAFNETGVLASISAALADAGVSIFVVSTFDTDYLLVRSAHLDRAVAALEAAGHAVQI
jgi:hypothetical protein